NLVVARASRPCPGRSSRARCPCHSRPPPISPHEPPVLPGGLTRRAAQQTAESVHDRPFLRRFGRKSQGRQGRRERRGLTRILLSGTTWGRPLERGAGNP